MPQEIILLCIAAFAAGFIDAIVGGGGLIQTQWQHGNMLAGFN